MLVYELYIFNLNKGYELIGVLPERRKNPMRITTESIVRWGRMLLDDDLDSTDILFGPIAIESLAEGVLWHDLSNHSINMVS
jgi:hypothetical protein